MSDRQAIKMVASCVDLAQNFQNRLAFDGKSTALRYQEQLKNPSPELRTLFQTNYLFEQVVFLPLRFNLVIRQKNHCYN
jgi:hypothetical protein